MTNDIAIRYCDEYLARNIADIDKEFLEKAKEALQQEPCSNCCNGNQIEKAKLCQKSYLAGMENKQKPCKDAISREAVLMELDKYLCGVPFDEKGIDRVIKELPSVKPQIICPLHRVDYEDCSAYEKKSNKWIGAEVLDDIRTEIDQYLFQNEFGSEYRKEILQIIDKYITESEEKE